MYSQAECKEMPLEELQEIFKHYPFRTQPRKHQLATMLWGMDRESVLYAHGIGTGKTLCALYTCLLWSARRILVVCPSSVRDTWLNEIPKHTGYKVVDLRGSAARRQKLLASNAHVFIVNYEGLLPLFTVRGQKLDKRKGELKTIRALNTEQIMRTDFDAVIFDECHHLRNPKTHRTQISYLLARASKRRILLTGTPTPKNKEGLWSLYYVLDDGDTFGVSERKFFETYFKSYKLQIKRYGRPIFLTKRSINRASETLLMDKAAEKAMRYSSEECNDLPPKTYVERIVYPTRDQQLAMEPTRIELKNGYLRGLLRESEIVEMAAPIAQIAGGFMYQKDGNTVRFKTNPKLDELRALLDEIDGKCIVFHNAVEEGRMIEEMCKSADYAYRSIRGETRKHEKMLAEFREDPDIKVLIMQPLSGGEGLNLQVANVVIFYSSPYVLRDQCEGRIHRAGQTKPCVVIDLIMQGSTDRYIVDSALGRMDENARLLDYIAQWGKGEE